MAHFYQRVSALEMAIQYHKAVETEDGNSPVEVVKTADLFYAFLADELISSHVGVTDVRDKAKAAWDAVAYAVAQMAAEASE